MITLILKSYFTIFLSVGIITLIVLCVGLYCIFSFFSKPKILSTKKESKRNMQLVQKNNSSTSHLAQHDLASIAGEDVIVTQLDLARAYYEADNFPAAKKLLERVIKQGDSLHKKEATKLLNFISNKVVLEKVAPVS